MCLKKLFKNNLLLIENESRYKNKFIDEIIN